MRPTSVDDVKRDERVQRHGGFTLLQGTARPGHVSQSTRQNEGEFCVCVCVLSRLYVIDISL